MHQNMADTKQQQAHLNGAYYGPPIPPQRDYRSVGRSSGCGPCCLLGTLLKFIISIVVVVGVIVLVLWLIFRPNQVKVHVDSATLTQFNLSANGNLNYNLDLNMSVRNPNKRIGIYYDRIEARAIYSGDRFGYDDLPVFYQGHKNTTTLSPAFQGQQLLLGGSASTTYNREKGEGYYYIEVKVYAKIRVKAGIIKLHHHFKPSVDCNLRLPVPGSNGDSFQRTRCHVDYW